MDIPRADSRLDVNENSNRGHNDMTSAISALSGPSKTSPHPQAAEIVRQIDHYFSEENLRQDAHLLALFQEGKGTVSLNEILGFKKMRKFKPRSAVKEAVKQSTVVEIVGNGKRLRRRQPLRSAITVIPKISADRKKFVVPEDKPWLTKGMMKPTGFEDSATSGPIDPKEYEEEREDYNPDNAFTDRIETAIRKFVAGRKFHTDVRLIFEKYMTYGGMDCGGDFIGGVDGRMKEDMTKKEIAEHTSRYTVSERVLDGFFEEDEGDKPSYIVDFEASAKGFLSSELPAIINWYDEAQVNNATRVLRSFFNYLLVHDVCPEYGHQLRAAFKLCSVADEEMPKLAAVDRSLPGGFNKACSTLFEGHYVNLNAPVGDWVLEGDAIGWTADEANAVFLAGIFAHGSEEQMKKVEKIQEAGEKLTKAIKVVSVEDNVGLEITGIDLADESARGLYDDMRVKNTYIKTMGKLRCKRWDVPHANPADLPTWVLRQRTNVEFEFLLDEDTLQNCAIGMKIEACVKELDLGIKFIDYFEKSYVSFFTFLWNERIRDWKEPGPPLPWMEKANAIMGGYALADKVDGEDVPTEEMEEELGNEELPD